MAYGQPMLQLYTSDPTIPGSNATGYTITDDNRAALQISYERLEESSRMADGTMRRFITANKKKVSTSWDTVPAAGGRNFTSDSNLSGAFLKSFFEENVYNPIWIKLTYSEEAWRFANSQSAVSNYGQTNLSYNTTTGNTGVNSEFTIKELYTKTISSGSTTAIIITKTPHNITPGSEIYITGVDQMFNGTWATDSIFDPTLTSSAYYEATISASPSAYLKFESTTITDSSAASTTLNSGGNITSASGTSLVTGLIGNAVTSSTDSFTLISSSALPTMGSNGKSFAVEFWIKGDSSASTSNVDIIRKLPYNLISNYSFESNTNGWSVTGISIDGTSQSLVRRNFSVSGIPRTGTYVASPNNMRTGSIVYSNNISVTSGSSYALRGYVAPYKLGDNATVWATIIWKNSSGSILSYSNGASVTLTGPSDWSESIPTAWSTASVIANAPVNAVTADIAFSQVTSSVFSGDVMNTGIMIDQILFEQSSTVNSNAGWIIKRELNDKISIELFSNYGSNAKVTSEIDVFDGEWHHVAMTTSITTANLVGLTMWQDGELNGPTVYGAATAFSNSYPIRINHALNSGIKDELMIYCDHKIDQGIIQSHYSNGLKINGSYAPGTIITFPVAGTSNNSYLDFNINSYTYSGSTATFNVDSTDFLYEGTTLSISNYRPYTGSSVFSSQIKIISIDSETTFTASGSSISAASATSSSVGSGFYGNAVIINSSPIKEQLSTIQFPKVGTAVTSDVTKVFITNFDYTIKKRFKMTDYVDVSMEFTEI